MNSYQIGGQIGYLIGVFIVGLLLGLIPFFVGLKMGDTLFGVIGLIACAVSCVIFPFGGVLAAVIFTILIIFKNR